MSSDWSKDAAPFGDAIDVSSRDGFAVEVQRPGPTVILLRIRGVIDMWTSLPLLDAMLSAFSEHPALIAVDVSDVPSMDDTGLHVLVEGSGHIEEGGVRCALICRAGSEVGRLLERADVHGALTVHESRDNALRPWLDGAGELPAGV